jgi:acetyl-CoA acetyltransferase
MLIGTYFAPGYFLCPQAAGKFKDEIVPVQTVVKDKSGNETPVVVTADDGIREGVSVETLGRLPTVFKKNGTTTAGNSSQVWLKDWGQSEVCMWWFR